MDEALSILEDATTASCPRFSSVINPFLKDGIMLSLCLFLYCVLEA
jgi:hypothetical protein